jgi:hypothetical protein
MGYTKRKKDQPKKRNDDWSKHVPKPQRQRAGPRQRHTVEIHMFFEWEVFSFHYCLLCSATSMQKEPKNVLAVWGLQGSKEEESNAHFEAYYRHNQHIS